MVNTYYQIVSQLNDKETKEFFNIFLSNIVQSLILYYLYVIKNELDMIITIFISMVL